MAFNFLHTITGVSSYLGVDIGTTSIKIAEVARENLKNRLINYAIFETFGHLNRINTALQTSTLKLFDQEIARYLRAIVKKSGFSTRDVIASLPSFSAFTTIIEIPEMSDDDVKKTIGFKAQHYIPLPLTAVTLDWIKVGERTNADGNKVQQIFLVSIPNEEIQKYRAIFQQAKLNLIALEVEGLSLARALTLNSSEPTLIIDIGSRSSTFLIGERGFLQYSNQSDFAGSSLTHSLAQGLGITMRRAEDLKRQKGLSGLESDMERELSTLLLPTLDVILNEAVRAKNMYETSYQKKIGSAVFAGGGANLIGLEEYAKKNMNIPIIKARPLELFNYPSDMRVFADTLGPLLSVSLGLTQKQLT